MERGNIPQKVEELLQPLVDSQGMEVVEVSYEKEGSSWFLRLYIDKPGGIRLDDCEEVSRYLSERLDALELIPHKYYLEVSSPGIERPLRKPADFVRYRGSEVTLRTRTKVDGQKNFSGKLADYLKDEGLVVLETGNGIIKIPLSLITRARLKVF